jgi:hypothetical protein
LLLTIGAFGAYWLTLVDVAFVAFIVPGLLLVAFGSSIFCLGTWRAGVAPRIGALLLVVGGPGMLVISDFATLGGGLVLVIWPGSCWGTHCGLNPRGGPKSPPRQRRR